MYSKTSLSGVFQCLLICFYSKEKRVNGSTIPRYIYRQLFLSFDCCLIQKKEIVVYGSIWIPLITVVVVMIVAVAVIVVYYREYIILLCYLYYFIVLKAKIKSLILSVL